MQRQCGAIGSGTYRNSSWAIGEKDNPNIKSSEERRGRMGDNDSAAGELLSAQWVRKGEERRWMLESGSLRSGFKVIL
jgi:hypothetical protein